MKICIPLIGFSKSGGMKVLTEFANRAEKFGHSVTFVVPAFGDGIYYPTTAKVAEINKNGRINNYKTGKKMHGLWKVFALYLYLLRNSKKFDVVIANQNITSYPVVLGSSCAKVYYIQAYEPEFADEYKAGWKRKLFKFTAWMTYFFPMLRIVNSEIYLNYKNLKANYVVHPGMDLDVFKPESDLSQNTKKFVVGCIGRTETWKGGGDVADAIKILREKNVEVDFKVAFNALDCEDYELVQPHGHKALADFYRSLNVMVAPGHIQLGAVHYPVIEAMACGTPVITTGYYPANQDNSIIVPIKSPGKIASAIVKIIDKDIDVDRLINNGKRDVAALSWDECARKFFEIIERELQSKK